MGHMNKSWHGHMVKWLDGHMVRWSDGPKVTRSDGQMARQLVLPAWKDRLSPTEGLLLKILPGHKGRLRTNPMGLGVGTDPSANTNLHTNLGNWSYHIQIEEMQTTRLKVKC